jgi:3-oxoacyl-[acyl-carrier-protein] synthase-3
MNRVGIIGVGEYLPAKILHNADLEKMVDTSDEWITTRTGIKQRRIVAPGQAASDLALKASQQALKDAKLQPEDLDLVIVATITPDIQFIASGTYKNALVVGTEVLTSVTDWKDRNTCVLFGDGAGAAVLAPVKSGGILSGYLGTDGSRADLLFIPAGGSRCPASHKSLDNRMHYLKMRGNELFKIAVTIMSEAAKAALKQAGLECKDVDLVIPHQANVRILMAMAKKLDLPKEKIYLNIEKYGNMSSASTATALCEAVKEGRVKKGDIILLDAFGAGLVWGACVIEW